MSAEESRRLDGETVSDKVGTLEGGWWCFGRCQRFVELNEDREMNVCGRCHQRTVAFRPGVSAERTAVRVGGKRLSPAEAHALFEQMREAVVGERERETE